MKIPTKEELLIMTEREVETLTAQIARETQRIKNISLDLILRATSRGK